jgi:hypothetical protein
MLIWNFTWTFLYYQWIINKKWSESLLVKYLKSNCYNGMLLKMEDSLIYLRDGNNILSACSEADIVHNACYFTHCKVNTQQMYRLVLLSIFELWRSILEF